MALVDVGDGDLSGGSHSRPLGLRRRKRQEEVWTRSLSLKQKLEEREKFRKIMERRQMTPAQLKIYDEQVQKTGGFDVYIPHNVNLYSLICPVPNFDKNPWMSEMAKRCASEAIDVYNNTHGTKFQFMRVVKLNYMPVAGYNLYITFEAKAKDATMYFQALVYAGIREDEMEVEFCRPQP